MTRGQGGGTILCQSSRQHLRPSHRLLIQVIAALIMLSACGDASGTAPGTVSVSFVGNATCDTTGQSPYSPSPSNTNSSPVGQPIDEMPHAHVPEGKQIVYNMAPSRSVISA